jgi:chemotaxis protein CheD
MMIHMNIAAIFSRPENITALATGKAGTLLHEDFQDQLQDINYFLEPGYMYFSPTPLVISTVLGSSVGVCLWDEKNHYAGINHFVYPLTRDRLKATPQYGNVATAALIRIMEQAGCRRQHLIAHIMGGANPEETRQKTLGQQNAEVAEAILKRKGIRIVSQDIGGTMGRKLIFDTATGHIIVLKVHKIRKSDWITTEPGRS